MRPIWTWPRSGRWLKRHWAADLALPDGFLAELRARTPMQGLVARKVRLSKSGRNWKGNCPFHNEKTPSFYVYEDAYHCFGCGVHGDAISFVMHTAGATFPEAVKSLADEAGLEVPKPTPAAAAAERQRLELVDVLDLAGKFYAHLLHAREGADGLSYLRKRGLSDETIARFGLGWSGDGRGGLQTELAKHDITPEMLVAAGLLRAAEDGRPAREQFYNRVMFPIRDRTGRVVSCGGRILGDGVPKYVNGPETQVFSKRRMLYGLDFARAAARAGQPVIVVEGYMDVIALHQAGFTGAVAPLGTALTVEQLEALWRLSPNPILCFDGDTAGGRAAARAAETALPLVTAARSLGFVTLPAGDDPDSLLRKRGPASLQSLIAAPRPLADTLFSLLGEGLGPTPEARAAFAARLEAAADRIADKTLAWEYRAEFRNRMRTMRFSQAGGAPGRGKSAGKLPLRPVIRQAPRPADAAAEKARILVAILLRHPKLLRDVEEAFAGIALPVPLTRLRDAMLWWFQDTEVLDTAALMSHLNQSGLSADVDQALSSVAVRLPECASPGAMPADAEAGWWHFFGLLNPDRLEEEVAAALRDFQRLADLPSQNRLRALSAAREALRRGETDIEA